MINIVTTTQKNKLAAYLFGKNDAVIAPNTYYIGLSTTQMGVGGSLSGEVSGNGYSRVEISNDSSSFNSAANGIVANKIRIEWPEATASWGTVLTVFVADAPTGGNVLYYSNVNRTVPEGATLYFAPGGLKFSITS